METSIVNKNLKDEASSPEIYLLFDAREDTAQVQGLSPGDWLVAADGALQYIVSELQDRFANFYNYRVRINVVEDYKSSFIFPTSPRKEISISLNPFSW